MGVELQVRAAIMCALVEHEIQLVLRSSCFDSGGQVFLDHADVVAGGATVTSAAGSGEIRVPVDVYLVTRDDVLAGPVPAGATAPAGRVVVVLSLASAGAGSPDVSMSCTDVDLGGLGAAAGAAGAAVRSALVNAVGSPLTFSLSQLTELLKVSPPAATTVEVVGDVVAIRVDPGAAPAVRLAADHQWGMFVDAATVERMVWATAMERIRLPGTITSLEMWAHWRPAGATPHVDVDYAGKAAVPDPLSGDFDGAMSCDLSVVPTPAQQLRTTVHWSFHLDLGALVPAGVESLVEDAIASLFDPTTWGGTPVRGTAFYLDSRLPDLQIGHRIEGLDTRLTYTSTVASPEGMTIGGPVRLAPEPSRGTLQISTSQREPGFSPPHFEVWASELGCTWGWGGYVPDVADMRSSAGVGLESVGHFCGFEVVSGGADLAGYVVHDAFSPESQTLGMRLPLDVSAGVSEPVRLIVITSRGVRLVDFGKPDPDAEPTGAYIDDCLYVDAYTLYWIELPVDPITGKPLPPPPPPWPPPDWNQGYRDALTSPYEVVDWEDYVEGLTGLRAELVEITGLDPGELIQCRAIEHGVDITADIDGRAVVPLLRAYRDRLEPAKLVRASRKSLDGLVTSRIALFTREAGFPAGQQNQLATRAGQAVVTTRQADRTEAYELDHGRAWSRLDSPPVAAETSIEQPGSPWRTDLAGVESIMQIPGFADADVAIATMTDGTTLVLDRSADGTTRVAGTFTGPIGRLDVTRDWAMATGRNTTVVYRHRRIR